jgi:hypothetical protein
MGERTLVIERRKTMSDFKPPKVVGYWKIIDLQVSASRKPNWFHRTMARALLGWEWRDKL